MGFGIGAHGCLRAEAQVSPRRNSVSHFFVYETDFPFLI